MQLHGKHAVGGCSTPKGYHNAVMSRPSVKLISHPYAVTKNALRACERIIIFKIIGPQLVNLIHQLAHLQKIIPGFGYLPAVNNGTSHARSRCKLIGLHKPRASLWQPEGKAEGVCLVSYGFAVMVIGTPQRCRPLKSLQIKSTSTAGTVVDKAARVVA